MKFLPDIFERIVTDALQEAAQALKPRTFYDQMRQPKTKKYSPRKRREERREARERLNAAIVKRRAAGNNPDKEHIHPRRFRSA